MSAERFLVDTTVWVNFFRGGDDSLKDRMAGLIADDRVCMTEIVVFEILRGARSQKEYNMLLKDFSALPVLSLDAKAWQISWETAFLCRQRGLNIPALDTLIASIAIRHGVTLMHSDRHYELLSRHTPLKALAL
jgi:hypothetical protein